MPIEIRELHIRVAVTPGPAAAPAAGGGSGAAPAARGKDDELVAQCVEQVMELLRGRTER